VVFLGVRLHLLGVNFFSNKVAKMTKTKLCPVCKGKKMVDKKTGDPDRQYNKEPCENCNGMGEVTDNE